MKIHPKDHRVMFGLVALLFAVSIVQTGGILKISDLIDSQKAQVLTVAKEVKGTRTSCFQITPKYNQIGNTDHPQNFLHTSFNIYFTVKNTCTYPINIVDVRYINYGPSLQISEIQTLGPSGEPENFDEYINQFGLSPGPESIVCSDCGGGVYYPSPAGEASINGVMSLPAYKILPGETKNLSIQTKMYLISNITEDFRVIPKNIKWFMDSAAVDNNIDLAEINNNYLTSAQSESLATDYSRLWLVD